MNGGINEPGDTDPIEDDLSEGETSEDVSAEGVAEEEIDLTADDEIVGESTAEINVDELVAKIDSEDPGEAAHKREVREKLEALREQRDDELGGTYNFNLDEDL